MDEQRFMSLTNLLTSYYKEHDFTPISLGVEKHGSWEWMAYWQDQLNQYVSLYLTEGIDVLGSPSSFRVEVWAGADNDDKYVRKPVSVFQVFEDYLGGDTFIKRLQGDLDIASQHAKSFAVSDLTESYFHPIAR